MKKTILFLTVFLLELAPVQAGKVIVISDLDDTILKSRKRGSRGLRDRIHNFFAKKSYPQMQKIYRVLEEAYQHRQIEFFYVSARPDILLNQEKWLKEHRFPEGETFLRKWNSGSTYNFKRKVIKKILDRYQEEQELKVFFFGDNAAKDPRIYLETVMDFQLEDFFIFIRKIKLKRKKMPGIHYFFSENKVKRILFREENLRFDQGIKTNFCLKGLNSILLRNTR